MASKTITPTPASHARRSVSLLISIGVIGGAVILGLNYLVLNALSRGRAEIETVSESLNQGAQEIEELLAIAEYRINAALTKDSPPDPKSDWLARINSAINNELRQSHRPAILQILKNMVPSCRTLGEIEISSRQHQSRTIELHHLLADARISSQQWITLLSAQLEKETGRARLEHVTLRRKYWNSSSAGRKKISNQLLALGNLDSISRLSLQHSLQTIRLSIEKLSAPQSILADLMDNKLVPAFQKLRQESSVLDNEPYWQENLNALLQILLGSPSQKNHPSVEAQKIGYISLLRELRNHEDFGVAQLNTARTSLNVFRAHLSKLNQTLAEQSASLTLAAEAALSDVWINMVLVGIVCLALFILLGNRIARGLSDQIYTIEAANRRLDEQAQALALEMAEREQVQIERERLQQQLVQTSRQVGMAEAATGVLHNVGNVLNSVNVTLTDLSNKLQMPRLRNLRSVLGSIPGSDLAEFVKVDPRGQQLPKYLEQAISELSEDRDLCDQRVQSLVEDLSHIKTIIKTQQFHARTTSVSDHFLFQEVLDDAIKLCQTELRQHNVVVSTDQNIDEEVLLDKHKVLMILINLIRNAIDAIAETGRGGGTIRIESSLKDANNVEIIVSDDGVGFGDQDTTEIFAHGFTTKADGHGFGLHSSALAAAEMGGQLQAIGLDSGASATDLEAGGHHLSQPRSGARFILSFKLGFES